MLHFTTIRGVRARREELARSGARLAFVPTMGALHEGHLTLVRAARELADEVWASVFVNPTQFSAGDDFARYPRDLEGDRALLARNGVAVLFAPSTKELYPRESATVIDVEGLASGLCGTHRPGHFRGVALVVAKLLNIVQPHVAVFGAKDAQQAAVIRRMVEDLNFPCDVRVIPTVREADGLAMSSRNAYLTVAERQAATAIHRALERVGNAVREGERRGHVLESLLAAEITGQPTLRLQYAAAVDRDTMRPVASVEGAVLLAVALYAGSTRLIDNELVEVS